MQKKLLDWTKRIISCHATTLEMPMGNEPIMALAPFQTEIGASCLCQFLPSEMSCKLLTGTHIACLWSVNHKLLLAQLWHLILKWTFCHYSVEQSFSTYYMNLDMICELRADSVNVPSDLDLSFRVSHVSCDGCIQETTYDLKCCISNVCQGVYECVAKKLL